MGNICRTVICGFSSMAIHTVYFCPCTDLLHEYANNNNIIINFVSCYSPYLHWCVLFLAFKESWAWISLAGKQVTLVTSNQQVTYWHILALISYWPCTNQLMDHTCTHHSTVLSDHKSANWEQQFQLQHDRGWGSSNNPGSIVSICQCEGMAA